MPNSTTNPFPILRSNYAPAVVIGLALTILAATVFFASIDLRRKSRKQLIQQDARILDALWVSQELSEESEGQLPISEKASDQWPTVLETAGLPQLAGLLAGAELHGTRLFDARGRFITADVNVSEGRLAPEDIGELAELRPVAHFRPLADLAEVHYGLEYPPRTGSLLEISIPLRPPPNRGRPQLLGIAQFILDGKNVAKQFGVLDRNLIIQSSATFIVGGGLLVLLLTLGFRQLLRVNRLLIERSQSLLRANQELALAAKTSAVGAVTSHLLHGLKNPLSGLKNFIATRGASAENGSESEWQLAVNSTRRMQSMINEVVRVLQDERGESSYELSLEEFVDVLARKVKTLADEAGIEFQRRLEAEAVLTNREANLISLILYNLIQNAIQATPPGKVVALNIAALNERIVCEISDQGPGIAEEQQQCLFKPCQSTKEGGSGVGLAISKQLANCIGAGLELRSSGPNGSVFILTFAANVQLSQEAPEGFQGAER
jgi:signal transduction histidine kinase